VAEYRGNLRTEVETSVQMPLYKVCACCSAFRGEERGGEGRRREESKTSGALFEDMLECSVALGGHDGVHDRKTVLALREILTEGLVAMVVRRLQVEIIVEHLVHEAELIHERDVVALILTEGLHQTHGQAEEPPGLLCHHVDIFLLRRTQRVVAPVDVHALASVEVEHFFQKYLDCCCVVEFVDVLESKEVDVVGSV